MPVFEPSREPLSQRPHPERQPVSQGQNDPDTGQAGQLPKPAKAWQSLPKQGETGSALVQAAIAVTHVESSHSVAPGEIGRHLVIRARADVGPVDVGGARSAAIEGDLPTAERTAAVEVDGGTAVAGGRAPRFGCSWRHEAPPCRRKRRQTISSRSVQRRLRRKRSQAATARRQLAAKPRPRVTMVDASDRARIAACRAFRRRCPWRPGSAADRPPAPVRRQP